MSFLLTWLHRARRALYRLYPPVTLGSRVLVIHGDQVLLVRVTYHHGWVLPGGGVKRGETFKQAAVRELREECGLEARSCELVGVYVNRRENKIDHVALYRVTEFSGLIKPQEREIAEIGFFPVRALPPDVLGGHRRRIEEHLAGRDASEFW